MCVLINYANIHEPWVSDAKNRVRDRSYVRIMSVYFLASSNDGDDADKAVWVVDVSGLAFLN